MLSGQELSIMDAVMLSGVGIAVVMLELAILAAIIVVLSKALRVLEKGLRPDPVAEGAAEMVPAQPAPSDSTGDDCDEIVAVITTVNEHHENATGEQIVIKSINILN